MMLHNKIRWLYVLTVVLVLLVAANLVYTWSNMGSGLQYQTIVGPAGDPGQPGERGIPGLSGAEGQDGDKGDRGDAGPQGPSGSQGSVGPAGPQGPQGPEGQRGPEGLAGTNGVDGERGAPGPAGPRGLPGVDGRNIELRGNNDLDAVEWRYTTGSDTNWKVLVYYCEMMNNCPPPPPPDPQIPPTNQESQYQTPAYQEPTAKLVSAPTVEWKYKVRSTETGEQLGAYNLARNAVIKYNYVAGRARIFDTYGNDVTNMVLEEAE